MACSCNTARTKIASYKVVEDITLQAERCFYVVEGLKSLLATFTMQTEFPVCQTKYNSLRDEYLEAYRELSITLRQIYHAVVPAQYISAAYDLEVDFEFSEVNVFGKEH